MNLRLRVTLAAIFSTALVIIIAGIALITLISSDAYDDLDNPEDIRLFEEYLIKNLALYFDKYETFCIDLSSDRVLKGEINFNYK